VSRYVRLILRQHVGLGDPAYQISQPRPFEAGLE
jgi:hypothetical protein